MGPAITEEAHTICVPKEGDECKKGCSYEYCKDHPEECFKSENLCGQMDCSINDAESCCRCFLDERKVHTRFNVQGRSVFPVCWGVSLVPRVVTAEKQWDLPKTSQIPCPECSAKCADSGITLFSPKPFTFAEVCASGSCDVLVNFEKVKTITNDWTHTQFGHSSLVYVRFWNSEDVDKYWVTSSICPGLSHCELVRSMWDVRFWLRFECMTIWNAIMLWILCGVTGILIHILAMIIWNLTETTRKTLPARVLRKSIGLTKRAAQAVYRKSQNWVSEDEPLAGVLVNSPEVVDDEEVMAPVLKVKESVKAKPMMTTSPVRKSFVTKSVLFAVMIFCYVSQIDCEVIMQGQKGECDQGICTWSSISRITLAPVGQRTSLPLLNQKGEIVGSIFLLTEGIELECEETTLYYTFNPSIQCSSEDTCKMFVNCYCGPQPTGNNTMAYTKNLLGEEGCDDSCGPCNRWHCGNVCRNFWKGLISMKDYRVSECTTWKVSPRVGMKIQIEGRTIEEADNRQLSPGIGSDLGDLTITMVNAMVPPAPFLSECFLSSVTGTSMTPCNKRNEISKGRVGEIQCPTLEDAQLSTHSCKADLSLIKLENGKETLQCSGSFIDLFAIEKKDRLPRLVDGSLVRRESGKIFTTMKAVSILEVTIEVNNLTVAVEKSHSLCSVLSSKLTGCYNCDLGAQLLLTAKTDSGSTVGAVKCGEVLQSAVAVTPSATEIIVNFKTNEKCPKMTCILVCSKKEVTFTPEGCLSEFKYKDFTKDELVITNVTINSNDTSEGFSLSSVGEWFKGLGEDVWAKLKELADLPWMTFFWVITIVGVSGLAIYLGVIMAPQARMAWVAWRMQEKKLP
jgi:hypothetical protein